MPEGVDIAVGARIRLRRRYLAISQATLGKGLGVSFQQIQKYELGKNRISASMLVRAAQVLRTTVAALIGENETQTIEPVIYAGLATVGAQELLRAFADIEDGEARRSVLIVARGLARAPDR
jgi:transcriptional regulator with XRE-family HTH domain